MRTYGKITFQAYKFESRAAGYCGLSKLGLFITDFECFTVKIARVKVYKEPLSRPYLHGLLDGLLGLLDERDELRDLALVHLNVNNI